MPQNPVYDELLENEELKAACKKLNNFSMTQVTEENSRLREREKELVEALKGIEPFVKEVVSRQINEHVFGFNGEILKLSALKKIESLFSF